MYEDGLAVTGAGALMIGGTTIGVPSLVAIAAGVIVVGAVLVRLATRRARRARG